MCFPAPLDFAAEDIPVVAALVGAIIVVVFSVTTWMAQTSAMLASELRQHCRGGTSINGRVWPLPGWSAHGAKFYTLRAGRSRPLRTSSSARSPSGTTPSHPRHVHDSSASCDSRGGGSCHPPASSSPRTPGYEAQHEESETCMATVTREKPDTGFETTGIERVPENERAHTQLWDTIWL
jgi:hypothetical protein